LGTLDSAILIWILYVDRLHQFSKATLQPDNPLHVVHCELAHAARAPIGLLKQASSFASSNLTPCKEPDDPLPAWLWAVKEETECNKTILPLSKLFQKKEPKFAKPKDGDDERIPGETVREQLDHVADYINGEAN
jgi:hypothetical protein